MVVCLEVLMLPNVGCGGSQRPGFHHSRQEGKGKLGLFEILSYKGSMLEAAGGCGWDRTHLAAKGRAWDSGPKPDQCITLAQSSLNLLIKLVVNTQARQSRISFNKSWNFRSFKLTYCLRKDTL